ncbi:hypothetical protein HaLaN_11590 [Haematococcus lacustris]|uniref:CBM20 domain-containing protein n=1 Tax=Haematococcus lacustris TaxID=44745 RepID=A0A699YYK1_HAELA|nr:hypothetical protein HaLaN_11590 [Haematococcus lacustris]
MPVMPSPAVHSAGWALLIISRVVHSTASASTRCCNWRASETQLPTFAWCRWLGRFTKQVRQHSRSAQRHRTRMPLQVAKRHAPSPCFQASSIVEVAQSLDETRAHEDGSGQGPLRLQFVSADRLAPGQRLVLAVSCSLGPPVISAFEPSRSGWVAHVQLAASQADRGSLTYKLGVAAQDGSIEWEACAPHQINLGGRGPRSGSQPTAEQRDTGGGGGAGWVSSSRRPAAAPGAVWGSATARQLGGGQWLARVELRLLAALVGVEAKLVLVKDWPALQRQAEADRAQGKGGQLLKKAAKQLCLWEQGANRQFKVRHALELGPHPRHPHHTAEHSPL